MKLKKGKKAKARIVAPVCPIHDKQLVCPRCAAMERGRKGGNKRAQNLTPEERQRIAQLGGRPRNAEPERPPNVLAPMNR